MLILNFVSPPLFPSERQSATSETAAVRFANAERGESGSLTCRNLKIADDGAGRCAAGGAPAAQTPNPPGQSLPSASAALGFALPRGLTRQPLSPQPMVVFVKCFLRRPVLAHGLLGLRAPDRVSGFALL
jgi:hypothetical protein